MEAKESTFRDMATKASMVSSDVKGALVWVYRWWTTLTLKKLMLTRNWDETKDVINEWREMDRDIGMAVFGKTMDEELGKSVQEINDVIEMMNDKIKEKEIE